MRFGMDLIWILWFLSPAQAYEKLSWKGIYYFVKLNESHDHDQERRGERVTKGVRAAPTDFGMGGGNMSPRGGPKGRNKGPMGGDSLEHYYRGTKV